CDITYNNSVNTNSEDILIVPESDKHAGSNMTQIDLAKISTPSRLIDVNFTIDNISFGFLLYERGSVKLKSTQQEITRAPCEFINEHNNIVGSNTNIFNMTSTSALSKLINQNQEDAIVKKALHLFDENIKAIAITSPMPNFPEVFIQHSKYDKKIPLSSFGGGMKKVLNIVTCIMNSRNGVVLIDEIDNGIHYSIVPKLWKMIFELSTEYNCQIFATTHSKEYTRYVVDKETNWSKYKDDFCFITLNDYNGAIVPSILDGTQFETALEYNSELRG